MNRRKAKKAFKKKWAQPGRCPLFRTVPNKYSPRVTDAINARFEEILGAKLDAALLYGLSGQSWRWPAGILGIDQAPGPDFTGWAYVMADRGTIPYALADNLSKKYAGRP